LMNSKTPQLVVDIHPINPCFTKLLLLCSIKYAASLSHMWLICKVHVEVRAHLGGLLERLRAKPSQTASGNGFATETLHFALSEAIW
jgi:hypothetical protein